MDLYEIVTKLIGEIQPVGETNADNKRFSNLETMTELVEKLLIDIQDVKFDNKNSHEYSVKKAAEFAGKFLDEMGIKEDE